MFQRRVLPFDRFITVYGSVQENYEITSEKHDFVTSLLCKRNHDDARIEFYFGFKIKVVQNTLDIFNYNIL